MPIEHVVVLCLENRSFDHMLGFLQHPDPSFKGLTGGSYGNSGSDGVPVLATPHAKPVLPYGPDHSHDAVIQQLTLAGPVWSRRPTNRGFVASYELVASGRNPSSYGGVIGSLFERLRKKPKPMVTTRGPLVMLCQSPEQVPVLSTLALEFAVCDQWFCAVPGETWPNRNYLHAATSDDETNIEIREYTDKTIFDVLEKNGQDWRIYHDDTPQLWAFPKLWNTPPRHAKWFPTERFAEHVKQGDLPAYTFIEPNHRPAVHTLDHIEAVGGDPGVSNSQHPDNNRVADDAYDSFDPSMDTDFARGERLIATIYEALRANPELFATTVFVITYDEHGGFYDHVPPTQRVLNPGQGHGRGLGAKFVHALFHRRAGAFDFTQLGVRVPTLIVSPLIERGTVEHGVLEHSSLPATLRALFAPTAEPLTQRDGHAKTFHHLWTRKAPRDDMPDLSEYLAPVPTTTAAAPGSSADSEQPPRIPGYYREFLAQGELVRQHLQHVQEPEVATLGKTVSTHDGRALTAAFHDAAHRHRQPEEGTPHHAPHQ